MYAGRGACGWEGRGWVWGGWRRQEAAAPEHEDLFQAVEQAREAGGDHGVQRGRQPERRPGGRGGGAQAGETVGQRRLVN